MDTEKVLNLFVKKTDSFTFPFDSLIVSQSYLRANESLTPPLSLSFFFCNLRQILTDL